MIVLSLMIVAVLLASAVLVWRSESPATMPSGRGLWAQRSAIAVLVLYALAWATMGFGEMASGISGGESHLFPAAAAAFLAFLGWRRPDATANVLLPLGAVVTLFLLWALLTQWRPMGWWYVLLVLTLLGGPFLLAGFLLKLATRRRQLQEE